MKKTLLTGILFIYSLIGIFAQCPSPIVPGVSLTQSPSGAICIGTNVTFTASPANGGIPVYEWTSSVNGTLAVMGATYSSNSLVNGEVITVKMTSSLACAVPAAAIATTTITVHANATPGIGISADKTTICPGDVVHFNAVNAVNVGSAPTYQWRKNATVIAGATNASYTASVISDQDNYNVMMTSGLSCVTSPSVTSSSITITVTPIPTLAVSVTADVNIVCASNPVRYTATITGAGPAPSYEWFITSSIAASVGVSQGAASTTAQTFTTSALTAINNKVYVQVVSNAACASTVPVASNVVATTISAAISAGSIGSDQTICSNVVPATITELSASNAIIPIYTWEASFNGTVWSAIAGSAGKTYPFATTLTQDVFLRRVVTDISSPAPCNVATSNVIHITVRPELMAGVILSDETICSGAMPAAITTNVLPTGGTGLFSYQWQSNIFGTFVNIAGATSQSYAPPALTITTLYRRVETSGSCGYVTSNVITKTIVSPDVVTASINNPGQICIAAPVLFTATTTNSGAGTLDYIWSLDGLTVGTNSPYYSYTSYSTNDTGKKLHVKVITSAGCNTGPAISNEVTLDIVPVIVPTISITSQSNPNCFLGKPSTFSINTTTGEGSNPIFEWYVNSKAVGSGERIFISPDVVDSDNVWVIMTSGLACALPKDVSSNIITMDIRPVPSPVINESDQTICVGESFTFTATVGSGTSLQWYNSNGDISGATNATYTATKSDYYYLQEDNSFCRVTCPAKTLTIDPCGAFSSSISGPNPVTNGQQNAVYSVPDQTGFSYDWSITGGTIVSGQNTHAVTVDWDAASSNALARTTIPAYAISVTETNPDGQKKTTTQTINTVATSIVQSLSQSGIKLFPNPAAESFSIQMPEGGMDVSYEILDLTGLSVASGSFTSTGSNQKIAADFSAGIYQVVLTYNNTVTTARLSKVQ